MQTRTRPAATSYALLVRLSAIHESFAASLCLMAGVVDATPTDTDAHDV